MPAFFLEALARFCSLLFFRLFPMRRRLVLKNLQAVFPLLPPDERERIALESLKSFALTCFETTAGGLKPIGQDVPIEGAAHLREALTRGKGALLLCTHLGNWEALAAAISQQVAPTHVIVKKVGDGRFDQFVVWVRRRLGYEAIAKGVDQAPARQIFKALARNEIVGFVMDQYQHGAPEMLFFGYPTRTNTGLATIWRRTEAPVIPVLIERLAPHRHRAVVWPPLALERSSDPVGDIERATGQFNRVMEKMVLFRPDQYFWLHDRWKWKQDLQQRKSSAPWSIASLHDV